MMNRLRNTGTIIAIVPLILLLLTTLGVEVPDNKVMDVIKIVCGILVYLGVMNNPETPGLDIPGIKK